MKPILFNTEMVRAILEGRKTVTRRVVKPNQLIGIAPDNVRNKTPDGFIKNKPFLFKPYCDMSDKELVSSIYKSPYNMGDVLYVRETWALESESENYVTGEKSTIFAYRADPFNRNGNWKPSIHMPKAAARIFLKVTDVRVERLQDITEAQAVKEGCQAGFYEYKGAVFGDEDTEEWTAIDEFTELWNSTIKHDQLECYSWEANPYVWVIEFERIDKLKVAT